MKLSNQELDLLIDLLRRQAKKDTSPLIDSLLLKFTEMTAFRSRKHFNENGRPKPSGIPANGAAKSEAETWSKIKAAHRAREQAEPEFGVDEFHPLFKYGDPKLARPDV